MPERTFIAEISWLERMPSSKYGNPRYRIHLVNSAPVVTAPNSSLAYGLENSEYRDGPVEITVNGRGHAIYIKAIGV